MPILSSYAQAQAPAGPLDAAQLLASIDRAVGYLKREQNPRGSWDDLAGYEGGVTALVTLALLNAGQTPDDPIVSKSLAYLRQLELDKTYTVSLQTMALCAAEPERDLVKIQANVDWICANQTAAGDRRGSWSYPGPGGDNSNSQFAVLALHDAEQIVARVDFGVWQRAAEYWSRCQNADGSWGYTPGAPGTGSMTCAGLGALVITSLATNQGDAQVKNGGVECCVEHKTDERVDRALLWLGKHFSVRRNPSMGSTWHYYYLYGVERVGRLTAHRLIGGHDWYREGAEFLVQEQDPLSQYWRGSGHAETNPHISTALALLFLSKGRRPIVMGKLQYGIDDRWNNHRHDAAHLTLATEKTWNLPLTWQVMDPKSASVDDLLQAPVLYISGDQAPELLGDAKKLRDYVDRGGFIFAESCCDGSSEFDTGFRRLITEIFPEPEYRLQPIRPTHPIWRMEKMVRANSPYAGKLSAVEYGCRTCVVYSQSDLSCYWELDVPRLRSRYPDEINTHIDDATTIGINVLTYATNREPKGKEQSFDIALEDPELDSDTPRGMIRVAKLQHGGGCNDAPGALVNLLRAAGQGEAKLRIAPQGALINVADESLYDYHLVFMHGRHDFRFTPEERKQLQLFLERGGTLLADSICASRSFTTAMRRELAAILPTQRIEQIRADDPLFTAEFGGYDIRQVSLRDPQPQDADRPLAANVRLVEPQLEGIQIGGRWAVVFSPFDISCALEKHEAVECRGYTRQDAARIGINVLLYSINQ